MVDYIRSLLLQWVFAKEKAQLDAQLTALSRQKKSLDARDVVREILNSYNPRTFKGQDLLEWVESNDEMSVSEFLVKAHELKNNKTLRLINEFLIDQQVQHIARYTDSVESMNFNRGSINGIDLIGEQIAELEDEYQSRKAAGSDFNEFDVT